MVHKEVLAVYVVLAFASITYCGRLQVKLKRTREELTNTCQRLEAILSNNKHLTDRQKSTRSLRHDMKHHLEAILAYVQAGRDREAQNYITSLGEIKSCLQQEPVSGNPLVDSVVRACLSKAAPGTHVLTDMLLPAELTLAPPELTIIFGNLVDNAVEATGFGPEDFIHVEAKSKGKWLEVVVSNSFHPEREDQQIMAKGSAKGPSHRGIGMKNVQRIVHKYGGSLTAQGRGNVFTVVLRLQLPTASH